MDEKDLYNQWNTLKQEIHLLSNLDGVYLRPKDVWMVSLGKNIGYEQNGTGRNFTRPILVIKKFNNQMFWVVPLSTTQKDLNFYYNFIDPFERPVSVILAQLKLMSIKRCRRLLYRISTKDFVNITEKLKEFLST